MCSYSCCNTTSKESQSIEALSKLLKMVTETSRLRLLCILRDGEHCVCEMMDHVDLSQSLISHHLKDLKEAKIVTDEKRGLKVYYKLTATGKEITNLLFNIPLTEEK
ncbi:winged helix-turn-helix transcriptional regulator [Candidatus Dojkabacteria bacterium]|nr:winged helix-turn-helix transcriptional regulator [Candidatus Dojkabacteria bacterium]